MATESENLQQDSPDPVPRWARDMEPGAYARCVELLLEGWKVPDVMVTLGIGKEKRASLYNLAKSMQRRRRLDLFGEMKTAVLEGANAITPQIIAGLKTICQMILTPGVDETRQQKGADVMVKFLKLAHDVGVSDEAAEAETPVAKTSGGDVSAMIAGVLKSYGKHEEADAVLAKTAEEKAAN